MKNVTALTTANNVNHDPDNIIRTRTYSGRYLQLTPGGIDAAGEISIRDIAAHLGKIVYYPESAHAPFTAAQYAVELATAASKDGPHFALQGLLINAHEAYLGHIPEAARLAERYLTLPPLVDDRRDQLAASMRARIHAALGVPVEPGLLPTLALARACLDATLSRDLGACARLVSGGGVRSPPLPYRIAPQRWDHAIEKYIRSWDELTALAGKAARR